MQERRQGIRVLIFEYATEGLRDHCDAAEGAALVFALSRRCDAATLPRRWGLLASSRLRDAATLPRRWGLLASSRRCALRRRDAATSLRSPRVFATLRRCDAAGGAARFFAVAGCCVDASEAAGGCSRRRVFALRPSEWNLGTRPARSMLPHTNSPYCFFTILSLVQQYTTLMYSSQPIYLYLHISLVSDM